MVNPLTCSVLRNKLKAIEDMYGDLPVVISSQYMDDDHAISPLNYNNSIQVIDIGKESDVENDTYVKIKFAMIADYDITEE